MIIPVRCFSCGQVVAHNYEEFLKEIKDKKLKPTDVLDNLGVKKYCCRRMYISNVEVIDEIMKYN
ncbi:DNA-directed RNA polymerase subunit N [archaeon]|nr:DNA-directed RNA polymerase subunit N [archaeon]NCP79555.1 DNA-directed RNA polymerase subunit N [archaeon]NCP97499.1 DNA-directed RNA polymerase subunit N [archaeon]NCQ07322.1 DNA-directed RNA polymerase subunit N [archaeon]NCQ51118.1 DNA-directed RNA polymerase subunit N [archaeon]